MLPSLCLWYVTAATQTFGTKMQDLATLHFTAVKAFQISGDPCCRSNVPQQHTFADADTVHNCVMMAPSVDGISASLLTALRSSGSLPASPLSLQMPLQLPQQLLLLTSHAR